MRVLPARVAVVGIWVSPTFRVQRGCRVRALVTGRAPSVPRVPALHGRLRVRARYPHRNSTTVLALVPRGTGTCVTFETTQVLRSGRSLLLVRPVLFPEFPSQLTVSP